MPNIVPYKHGLNVVDVDPTGDAGDMLNDDLRVIGDNFDAVLNNQSVHMVYAGPASGGAAAPSFRALTVADLPGGGSGTVTSVALTAPAEFTVSGSPVTTSGTLAIAKANQSANLVYAGPSSGGAAAPTFRSLVAGDVPTLNQNTTGTASNVSGTVAIGNGGTGQTSKSTAFDALSPMTTSGDVIYGGASGTGTRLAPPGVGLGHKTLHSGTPPTWGYVDLSTEVQGSIQVGNMNSGTNATSTTYWRGDQVWASAPQQVRITFDGGGSAITTGGKVWSSLQFAGTITGYTLLADQSGSIVISVKKSTYSGFPTTSSITGAGTPPTLSSAQKATDATLTSWTTSVSTGDILEFSVTSASTVTHVQLFLNIQGA